MKKLLVILSIMTIMYSCTSNSSTSQKTTSDSTKVDSIFHIDSMIHIDSLDTIYSHPVDTVKVAN